MKIKKIVISIIVLSLTVSYTILPIDTKAKTIKQFEDEINKYTQELQEKKDKIAKNDAEVAEIKKKIANLESQITKAEQDIESLQQEIDKSNEEIKKKSEESKKIMEYYQIANGENAYLEYAFGATSITDMIYRMSVVEQLTEYNDKIMKELEALIKKNKTQQEELTKKKEEFNKLQKDLESEKARIDADSAAIKAGMPGIEDQIKSAKSQLSYAKSLGCGTNEDVNACIYRVSQSSGSSGGASVPSTNGFYRPMEYGYITQRYTGCGYFNPRTQSCSGHIGMDLSSSNKSIDLYPIADGYVSARYYDNAGALVLKIKHNYNGRYIYSTYAHMRSFAVSAGQYISHNTTLGKMGSTGNSTGSHLHLEVTSCDWKSAFGGCSWETYAKSSTMNPAEYVIFPSSWSNR